jgi:hypothetical protein
VLTDSTAAAPLAVISGASAPGSAVIVAGPVTVSAFAAASHVAALPGASQAGADWKISCTCAALRATS